VHENIYIWYLARMGVPGGGTDICHPWKLGLRNKVF